MGIRCVIVDDSEHFRVSARRLLSAQGVSIVADAADSRQALRAVEEHDPDVVLVDVNLGSECGFELAERLRSRTVIMISSILAPDEVLDLMASSSAIGYLPKNELSADAIKRTLSHETDRE